MEIWKDLAGYEGIYQVSTQGKVRSLDRVSIHMRAGKKVVNNRNGVILKASIGSSGYFHVLLSKEHNKKLIRIHRLVAETFLIREDEDLEVNHLDGNKKNNTVENLEWVTHKENSRHAYNSGLYRRDIKKNQIIEELTTNQTASAKEVAARAGVTIQYVYHLRKGIHKSNICE